MSRPTIDLPYTLDVLVRLLDTPSPTGFTERAVRGIEEELRALGITPARTRKGALTWEVAGSDQRHVTFSGHVDTLGAMVKHIKRTGRVTLSALGGYDWATVEGEDVRVHTQSGRVVTGTVVNIRQSTHVHGAALRTLQREQSVMEVRLDEPTWSADETRALGIAVGDFVSFDARPRVTPAGYVKARHLDNKAAVAVFLGVTRALREHPPTATTAFHVTTYEEVGHGAATGIPPHTDELIAVDMAAVGENQQSSEHHVTLCVADSGGPYDHALGNRLRASARRAGVALCVDIYPYYASDGTAAWRAGGDYPVALIGPGVDASHAYERTHTDALVATGALMLAHVRDED
ncbi:MULTISPECIES: M42 family metallopeptidase [Deinococcus]|uniref:M42 family metallopeptidase n=1 Tax=Deinococcus rufus TaxID=2136097 RepID=A0ABV7Z438_9DEIO|nr:M42 family metallopeptidase [Deinococcus sp. AB2017081]WQE96024.1 M42 family metallopeptidase [Deinococcus sp. AB2017081]